MWSLRLPGIEGLERPRLNVASIRQLVRLGTLVRWPGIIFGAVLGLVVPPKSPVLLALLLVWVAAYNAWGLMAIPRATDASILRIGRTLVLLDTLSFFAVLALFGGVGGATSIYVAYILLTVWMVAYDGAEGAMLAVAIFVIGMIVLQGVLVTVYGRPFNGQDVLLWSLIMVVAGAILAAFDRILVGAGVAGQPVAPHNGEVSAGDRPVRTVEVVSAVRLSPREQEVLQLMSEGYSNSMIASRLHLSENTIKTYVETLLTRLKARNRAEAVASAARQNLI
jgi:DNA-binding CsgD family transcriptional regulator